MKRPRFEETQSIADCQSAIQVMKKQAAIGNPQIVNLETSGLKALASSVLHSAVQRYRIS